MKNRGLNTPKDVEDVEHLGELLVRWMRRKIKKYDPYPIRWKHYSNFFLNSDDPPPERRD